MEINPAHDQFQVIGTDVECLPKVGECSLDILGMRRRQIALRNPLTRNLSRPVRIALSRKAVKRESHCDKANSVQRNRKKRKRVSCGLYRRPADYSSERGRSSRWMQTPSQRHDQDCEADGQTGCEMRRCNRLSEKNSYQSGKGISANHRPWLCQRACRNCKHQDSRCSHRSHDQRERRCVIEDKQRYQTRHSNAYYAPSTCGKPITQICAGKYRGE